MDGDAVILIATTMSVPSSSPSVQAAAVNTLLQIKVLSNRADLVSGGDALLEIVMPPGLTASNGLQVVVGSRNVSSAFTTRADGRTLGVVTGLVNGTNTVLAKHLLGGNGQLVITNHPIGGPVLLSSQIGPWICATPVPTPAVGNTPGTNASGLSTFATDAQCNIATEYNLFYRTTNAGCSNALPDPSPPTLPPANDCFKPYTVGSVPADLAMTTTTNGVTVPYIVRIERGTINRGIYDIAVLFDPTKPWTAVAPQSQWNRKVVYSYGASTGQPRLQFRSEQNWADDNALSRGFMVVDNSLTDSLYNSNRVLTAETTMMMKEHIVDSYGEVLLTMGNGCSGGSIGQNTVSSIYPGLLDGIQVQCDYPDSATTNMEVSDCVLLVNFYAGPEWAALMTGLSQAQINAKKTAINGHIDQTSCHSWNNSFGFNNKPGNYVRVLVADAAGTLVTETTPRNNCLLPAALVYDPVTNPNGPRCGDPDLAPMIWGTVPGGARANRTGDNVGVQYGLKALMSGAITAEEFVTLNEKIGGFDADSNRTVQRMMADAPALPIAYRAGIVSSGRQLGKVPIIDLRGWDETGIHYIWRSFSERDRLDQESGSHVNQLMWRFGTGLLAPAKLTLQSFLTMDAWLTNLTVSAPKSFINGERTQSQVIGAKPALIVGASPAIPAEDLCYLTGDTSFLSPVFDFSVCDQDPRLMMHTSPRQVAGGPRAENILKCQLRPLNFADYPGITFNAAQQARLQTVFASGVCDWTQPGVGQQPPQSPLQFTAGPGGVPLGPPPVGTAIGG
jgi:hypothetical protein